MIYDGPCTCWLCVQQPHYHWLGTEAEQPICDGDLTHEEHIEADGFITVYFSGPIRPLPQS
jgi:hypothetical protein